MIKSKHSNIFPSDAATMVLLACSCTRGSPAVISAMFFPPDMPRTGPAMRGLLRLTCIEKG